VPFWICFVLFEVGWTLTVVGNQSYIYLTIIPLIIVYFWFENRAYQISSNQQIARLLLTLFGFCFDSTLEYFELISFSVDTKTPLLFAPLWLFLLWFWFSLTFSRCYSWLLNHAFFATLLGALFGPISYWGASKVSIVTIDNPLLFTTFSIIFWSSLFALIFSFSSISKLFIYKLPNNDKDVQSL